MNDWVSFAADGLNTLLLWLNCPVDRAWFCKVGIYFTLLRFGIVGTFWVGWYVLCGY